MRKATRVVAALLGAFAGFGGPEHGYFEILRGNVKPDNIIIASMGPPCDPETVWHACEPAMTILPNYLAAGIVSVILGLLTMIWAGAFVQKKHGGLVLILLSILLLLSGGGLFPPVIGIIAGILGTRINVPLPRQSPGAVRRFFALLWPWPMVAFFAWVSGQMVIGHYFNEFMRGSGFLVPGMILGLMALSIISGAARDAVSQADSAAVQASAG